MPLDVATFVFLLGDKLIFQDFYFIAIIVWSVIGYFSSSDCGTCNCAGGIFELKI